MRCYTLGGSFGFHNVGDEIIVDSVNNMFNSIDNKACLNVLCRYEKPDLNSVIAINDTDKLESISNTPLFLSGGGIIENKDSCVLLKLGDYIAKTHRSKISYLGVSVEPGINYSLKNKIRLKKLLKKSSTGSVYTRDFISENTLRNNLKGVEVETIGDLALWAKPSKELPTQVIIPDNYVAVSLCNTWKDSDKWYEWIASELDRVHLSTGLPIVFVPMSTKFDDDRVTHDRIYKNMKSNSCIYKIDQHLLPSEALKLFSLSSLVIASRLHSCVLAYGQRVPFVGISYHPKLIGFAHTVGKRDFILPNKIPESQSNGFYGFSFESLNLQKDDLLNLTEKALASFDFNFLEHYKMKSLNAMRKMLASFEI